MMTVLRGTTNPLPWSLVEWREGRPSIRPPYVTKIHYTVRDHAVKESPDMAVAPADPRAPDPTAPAAGAPWEPIVGAIGPKVRDLRQGLGLSLQQLAQRSGVSAAAIHKVERGDMVPTITT